MSFVYVGAGIVLLIAGGEGLVRGAVTLARRLGVTPMVIGLTVVAIGTSAPELVVCVQAALTGHPDIVLGNVIGSNTANVLLIVGVAAAMSPVVADPQTLRRDGWALIIGTVAFVVLCQFGTISRLVGAIMVLAIVTYTTWSFRAARRLSAAGGGIEAVAELEGTGQSFPVAALLTVAGLVGVVFGAHFLVEGAVAIARMAGLSEAVIGLTLIALGTSLPELAASVMAALRGQAALSIGNAMGSNMFNMYGIAGASAVVQPVPVPVPLVAFDLWIMMAVTAALVGLALWAQRLNRGHGVVMVLLYCGYVAVLVSHGGLPVAG